MTRMIYFGYATTALSHVMPLLTLPQAERKRVEYPYNTDDKPNLDAHFCRLRDTLSEPLAAAIWDLRFETHETIKRAHLRFQREHDYEGSYDDWVDDIQFIGAYLTLWAREYFVSPNESCANLKGTTWYRFFEMEDVAEGRLHEVIFLKD